MAKDGRVASLALVLAGHWRGRPAQGLVVGANANAPSMSIRL